MTECLYGIACMACVVILAVGMALTATVDLAWVSLVIAAAVSGFILACQAESARKAQR